ncbi:YaaL family protein [Bacillus sp. SCS-153A]|uniref:YaaL family protein n=1 Tax=Rossellomorea sedimentorum TaxID=3115294 RepID=UPI003905E36D
MFFQKKGKLRKEYDTKLLHSLEDAKKDWISQKALEEMSIENSFEINYRSKIAEAKYFFFFREAKNRKVVIKR